MPKIWTFPHKYELKRRSFRQKKWKIMTDYGVSCNMLSAYNVPVWWSMVVGHTLLDMVPVCKDIHRGFHLLVQRYLFWCTTVLRWFPNEKKYVTSWQIDLPEYNLYRPVCICNFCCDFRCDFRLLINVNEWISNRCSTKDNCFAIIRVYCIFGIFEWLLLFCLY